MAGKEQDQVIEHNPIRQDLVFNHTNASGDDAKPLQERINRQHGTHITEYAESIGLGKRKYNINNIDSHE